MQTDAKTKVINEEKITDPSMSETPRRVTKTRAALIVVLVLAALGFAGAIYFDNSRGSLADDQGIISE